MSKTILIVDDNFVNRRYLTILLGSSGHYLLEASDGVEALALIRLEHPDLVITDIMMPRMDGYELVHQLRTDPEIAQTPVIFCTAAYLQAEAQALADSCGVFRLLIKPLDSEVILETVKAALCSATPPSRPLPDAMFEHNHQRLLTDKLAKKVEELEQEIEERKCAEETLRASEERYRLLFEACPDGIILMNKEGRVQAWNPAAERIFGWTATEAMAESSIKFVAARDILPQMQQPVASVNENITKDGRTIICEWMNTPLRDAAGNAQGFLSNVKDITDRKFMETQLAHAQKMESIGQLAAGIAHEINTPIQYIGDNNLFLKESFKDLCTLFENTIELVTVGKSGTVPTELVARIEMAMKQVDVDYLLKEIPIAIQQSLDGITHVTKIVQAMKEFSHPGTKEKVAVNINRAIESTLTVARNEWKYVAEMVTHFDLTLPTVPCLPGEFNQVILNLVINATHAIAEAANEDDSHKGVITILTCQAGDWAEVHITDTGLGIPKSIGNKVFNPFFTTKEVGKGTGQGLAMAHSIIVDKHGGTIHFETETGRGTTFILRLPLREVQQVVR